MVRENDCNVSGPHGCETERQLLHAIARSNGKIERWAVRFGPVDYTHLPGIRALRLLSEGDESQANLTKRVGLISGNRRRGLMEQNRLLAMGANRVPAQDVACESLVTRFALCRGRDLYAPVKLMSGKE